MVQTINESIEFYKGTYLDERNPYDTKQGLSHLNEIQEWRDKIGVNNEIWKKRLHVNNLVEEDMQRILANKERPLLKEDAKWIKNLSKIVQTKTNNNLKDKQWVITEKNDFFLEFYRPFITYAYEHILSEFNKLHDIKEYIEITSVTNSILKTLHQKIYNISIRTLIFELNLARIGSSLKGNTPTERYNYFTSTFLAEKKNRIEIFKAYPVLARLIIEEIETCISVHLEVINRFIRDKIEIANTCEGNFNRLIHIHGGAGDTHQQGQSVMILEFTSGDKIVYKPRSLSVDKHFQELLLWINNKKKTITLKENAVVDKNNYGWQEFVQHQECASLKEVKNFYKRQGSYLAIFYLLYSRDFHYENLIAHGEHPMFIDLETLFSNNIELKNTDSVLVDMQQNLSNSVLGSMMLPVKFSDDNLIDYDLSGLGGKSNQESQKIKVWKIEKAKTDEMYLTQESMNSIGSENLPFLNGLAINAYDFSSIIEIGFREMYDLFLENKEELLSLNGPLYKFSNDHFRHVVRATEAYSKFLTASLHPDYLQDGLNRVQLFDYFWQTSIHIPKFISLIPSECKDLLHNDVPYFTFKGNSTSIFDSRKKEIKNFFPKNSLQQVLDRCVILSKEDCEDQLELIKLSLQTLKETKKNPREKQSKLNLNTSKNRFKDKRFLSEAEKIGEYLVEKAFWNKNKTEAHWFGINCDTNNKLRLSPLGLDLYDGSLGITIFLALLAEETKREDFKRLSKASLQYVESVFRLHTSQESSSVFSGFGSIVYSLAYLGIIWKDKSVYNRIYEYTYDFEKSIENDSSSDFIGGLAGALIVCLRVYSVDGNIMILNLAKKCGERLTMQISKQIRDKTLWTGFAHGASGIAWSMVKLGNLLNDDRFLQIGLNLINYENEFFVYKNNNWRDLRNPTKVEQLPVYWCHGAPGIGLGRLMILSYYQEDRITNDLDTSIKKTLDDGFGFTHCLCHGDFGNIDFLLLSSKYLNSETLENMVISLGNATLENGLEEGWKYGNDTEVEMLGLMTGIAGIGYGLLRLWNSNIPSILALEIPLYTGSSNEYQFLDI
ncbi:type 2 lanthipeptide synthetase LanM family protein [Bacillus cereus group sp. BfR-BA-01347]|uniref:type 2 lanthipeptide synthetase LanM family protein n=1 Tax=Bacillus cereus group sp. BfR-BA-01347 TaxID=2920310 RepID=UPI001F561697|nr:type 2 lanthipeptide synthetase LanM family protein [Bacillus cereus group sp. BfR-BA-01347]